MMALPEICLIHKNQYTSEPTTPILVQRRKVTYKAYPSARQAALLMALLNHHKALWNAALEERIDAWRKARKSLSYEDQCASLTQLRAELPEDWGTVNCSSQQITLRRLSKAFQAFFARVRKGQSPGFPRFKSTRRLPGFGYKGHGDGWKFEPALRNGARPDDFGAIQWGRHGVLRLQGVGHIKLRGQARAGGTIKSCELMHQNGEWSVSVTIECADVDVEREAKQQHAMGADWGVSRLLTIVRTDGPRDEVREDIENPRWFQEAKDRLVALDRAVSSKRRGSKNWKDASRARSRLRSKIARKRHDFQHKLSATLARRCAIFASEKLSIKNMTSSAAGTVEEPGKNVRQKAALNREILDTAAAALLQKIAYKVVETGGQYLEAPTRKLKPSQTCPACGTKVKKELAQRWHCCHQCGHEEDRDAASARVVLRWALGALVENTMGQELAKAA